MRSREAMVMAGGLGQCPLGQQPMMTTSAFTPVGPAPIPPTTGPVLPWWGRPPAAPTGCGPGEFLVLLPDSQERACCRMEAAPDRLGSGRVRVRMVCRAAG